MSLFRPPFLSSFYGRLESEHSSVNLRKEFSHKKRTLKHFDFVAIFAHVFGITMMVLAFYMYGNNDGGLKWDHAAISNGTLYHGNMNFHGIFMSSSFIFLQGEALIVYRIFRHEPKVLSKSIHVLFHLCVLGLGSLGIVTIVKEKRLTSARNMFSFHSWIGVSIITVYGLQAIIGFISFVFPKIHSNLRHLVMPIHRFVGQILFGTSVAQALIGNTMFWFFTFKKDDQGRSCYFYLSCPKHVGLILNFYIVFMALYAICIGLLLGKDAWKREPTLDEKKIQ